MAGKKHVTMKDVATLAGVSQPTVSYVFNGSARISDEVKQRVFAAAEELGYKPSAIAHAPSLKAGSSREIAILIPDIMNQYYSRICEQLQQFLREKRFQVSICPTGYAPETEHRVLEALLHRSICGIIVTYQFSNSKCWQLLKQHPGRCLTMEGGKACAELGIMNISVDDHLGGYMATRFLLNKGRKRIAFIQQNASIDAIRERTKGYKEAMQEAKLYDASSIFSLKNDQIDRQVLTSFDGIITTSDILAVRIINELKKYGRSVPGDVSIIGYDNIPLAELVSPTLTTMGQPILEMCSLAANYMTGTHEANAAPISLQPALFIRESA